MAPASDFVPILRTWDAATPPTESRSAHLVGICGAGMSALGSMFLDLGWFISGSDLQPTEPLSQSFLRRGVRIQRGHDVAHLPPRTDVLVYSAAIPAAKGESAFRPHNTS